MQYLFTAPYVPFTVALLVMFGIGLLEALGLGLSAFHLDIGIDAHGHDVGLDADADGPLDWLGIGEVPLLMIVVVSLTLFGLSGLILQNTMRETTGHTLPLLFAVPIAFAVMIPLLGVCSRFMARVMPKDETTAISIDELRGHRARIILGQASPGNPTRATITDLFGQTHYLLVEPDIGTVSEGDELILVRREGDLWFGTSPYSSELHSI